MEFSQKIKDVKVTRNSLTALLSPYEVVARIAEEAPGRMVDNPDEGHEGMSRDEVVGTRKGGSSGEVACRTTGLRRIFVPPEFPHARFFVVHTGSCQMATAQTQFENMFCEEV